MKKITHFLDISPFHAIDYYPLCDFDKQFAKEIAFSFKILFTNKFESWEWNFLWFACVKNIITLSGKPCLLVFDKKGLI